jgi:NDP-sugar pyrophosphorylase family protein
MTSESPVTIIFPMAGRGARFGYTFKPFLQIGGETFIEAAVRPFVKWLPKIRRFVFVYLEEQEREFSIRARLDAMFGGMNFETIQLPAPTPGPAETLTQAIQIGKLTGPLIACDCDHSINLEPLFQQLMNETEAVCILPVWGLDGEDVNSWSVALLDQDDWVVKIAEKRRPAGDGKAYFGVIGCYYFSDATLLSRYCLERSLENVSDVINALLAEGNAIRAVHIKQAEFFGDPARLQKTLDARRAVTTR